MLDHKHIIVTAAVRKPIKEKAVLEDWFRRLIVAVDMKIVTGPHVEYVSAPGNEGLTGACCIETSHCSMHIWDSLEVPYLKFDLYSCKCFDPQTVIDLIAEFDPYYYKWVLLDRNHTIQTIDKGSEQVVSIISLMEEKDREIYLAANTVEGRKNRSPEMKAARAKYAELRRKYSLAAANHIQRKTCEHYYTLSCIKSRAKKNKLSFDLDKKWYDAALAEAKTKYPKLEVHQPKQTFWSADVDRLDPNKGYLKDNCRIIPHGLNVAKWNWNKEELVELSNLIQTI
jgi:S-adenosylmethionine/arginine decarboxylase-like enzyme